MISMIGMSARRPARIGTAAIACRSALLPYRQGELDGCCGLYAVINGIRLARCKQAEDFTLVDCQAFFYALLLAADEVVGAAQAVGCGLDAKPLLRIVKIAAQHLADEHDLKLTAELPFKGSRCHHIQTFLPRLTALSQQPCSAILLTLKGHLDHWSVLRRVGGNSLELLDSSGFARVALANCRVSSEPQVKGRREHVIDPGTVLRITVQ